MRPAFAAVALLASVSAGFAEELRWRQLPAIPDGEGFAGTFAGVSGGALIVAGGANIAGDRWAEAPAKTWYDSVFVLDRADGAWRSGFKLPRPLGYGVSVTADDALICIGGGDATRHFDRVLRLLWRGGAIAATELPRLPKPCANACGALIGRTIYVAGGIETPSATAALRTFWALDLGAREPRWRELEPWPGPERMLAVAGAQDGAFFLFSGARLDAGGGGKPVRTYLRDAYRYAPNAGWKRLADLPRAAVAAVSPAVADEKSRLLVISGDDGEHVKFSPAEKHPGFPRNVLAYDVAKDSWSIAGSAPFSRATTPSVQWSGFTVIPNGEVRPRVRTPEVWALELP